MRAEGVIRSLVLVWVAGCVGAQVTAEPAVEIEPHVCVVNVAKAVDSDALRRASEEGVAGVMSVNIRLAAAEEFGGMERFDLRRPDTRFGKEAKLIIYVVNDPALPFLTSVPGRWALVNVRGLDRGLNGDAGRYDLRLRKVLLKGLAYAAGVGVNADIGRCVMALGSLDTLEGIDSTSATYSPFAAFPLMDILAAKGVMRAEETDEGE